MHSLVQVGGDALPRCNHVRWKLFGGFSLFGIANGKDQANPSNNLVIADDGRCNAGDVVCHLGFGLGVVLFFNQVQLIFKILPVMDIRCGLDGRFVIQVGFFENAVGQVGKDHFRGSP